MYNARVYVLGLYSAPAFLPCSPIPSANFLSPLFRYRSVDVHYAIILFIPRGGSLQCIPSISTWLLSDLSFLSFLFPALAYGPASLHCCLLCVVSICLACCDGDEDEVVMVAIHALIEVEVSALQLQMLALRDKIGG